MPVDTVDRAATTVAQEVGKSVDPRAGHKEAVSRIRQKVQEIGAQKFQADSAAGLPTGVSDVDRDAATGVNISRNLNSQTVWPGQIDRVNRGVDTYNNYFKEGHTKLAESGDPQKEMQAQQLRQQVHEGIQNSAFMRDFYNGLTPQKQDQLVRGYLGDKAFTAAVNRRLQQVMAERVDQADVDKVSKQYQAMGDGPAVADVKARTQAEAAWMQKIDNVAKLAMQDMIADNLAASNDVMTNQATTIDQAINADAISKGKKAPGDIMLGIDNRLRKRGLGLQSRVASDYSTFSEGGLREYLASINTDPDHINTIMSNPSLEADMTKQVGKELVLRMMQRDELTSKSIRDMANNPLFGATMDDRLVILEEALRDNKRLDAVIKQGEAAGYLPHGLMGKWKELPAPAKIGLFAGLMSLLFVAPGVVPAMAGTLGLAGAGGGVAMGALEHSLIIGGAGVGAAKLYDNRTS